MIAAAPFRLETCACPLCGEPSPEYARAAFPPYYVVDWASCSMRYLSPRVLESDVPRLYGAPAYWEKGGPESGYSSYSSMEPLLVRTFVRRLSSLPPRGGRRPPPRRGMRPRRRPRGGALSRVRGLGSRRVLYRGGGRVLALSRPRPSRDPLGSPLSAGLFQSDHALRRHRARLRPPPASCGPRVAPGTGGAAS
jgi:hypothetical protein